MSEIESTVRRFAAEHARVVNELTEAQAAEAIRQAVLSGDFVRHVCIEGAGVSQSVTYIPGRESDRLRSELTSMTAERDRYHDALIAKHGGEPIALLSELDEAREELASVTAERDEWKDKTCTYAGAADGYLRDLSDASKQLAEANEIKARLTSEIRLAREKWLGSTYDHLPLADAVEAALDARGRAPVDPALEVVRAELAQAKDEVKRLNTIVLLGNIPVDYYEAQAAIEEGVQLYRRRE